jgi:hypothetical protein
MLLVCSQKLTASYDFTARRKRENGKSRASTADELEAANADVKAAFSRILAAKRASLSSSLADHSLIQHSESTDVPHKGQLIRHSETATPQPTLNGKNDISQYSDVVSDPSSSRTVIAEGVLKARGGVSNLTISRSSSGSSDDESEDQNRLGPTQSPIVPVDALQYADLDLDALIRGPKVSAKVIADLSSTGSSEDEGLDLAEDDEERQTSRPARKIVASDSSEDTDDDDDDDDRCPSPSMDSRGSSPQPDVDNISFQLVDRLGRSQEIDNSGDVAFHAALAADTAMFKLADHNDATLSVLDPVPDAADNDATLVQSSEGGTPLADPVHPMHGSQQTEIPSVPQSPPVGTSITFPESGSAEKQRREGIIRRMKGRSGRYSERDSAAGTPRKYNGQQPEELDPDSAIAISMDGNGHKQGDRSLSQQVQGQANGIITSAEKSMSLDTWTTLRASSPLPETESTIMIDELRSSSPGSQSQLIPGKLNSKPPLTSSDDPLFILTESQPPFPYSQWSNPEDHQASNDSEDEQEVQASVQSQSQAKTTQPPKYRRLTDIAGHRSFFSTPSQNLRPTRSSSNKLADMYGRTGVEEIESASDSDSDSDAQVPVRSHIPKSRIAGVSRQVR